MKTNIIIDALIGEHGRLDEAARVAVELHDPHGHDLHRLADDGCPHHHDNHDDALWQLRYVDLRRQGYTEKEATEMADQRIPDPQLVQDILTLAKYGEAVPAVVQKSDHGLHLPSDAKARKALPIWTGVMDYFPKAIAAVAEVSRIGNDQHNPGQPLHWAKGKSTDHVDCAGRHLLEHGIIDTDGGRHTAKAAWRVLALLEMEIEAEEAGMSYADYIALLKAQDAAADAEIKAQEAA